MKNNNKPNTLLLTVIGVATLLVAVIGATFAYFTASIGTTENSVVDVRAGKFTISYAGGSEIESTSLTPVKPTGSCVPETGTDYSSCTVTNYENVGQKIFTLTGTNTSGRGTASSPGVNMPYEIRLNLQKNEFLTGTLKYTLSGTITNDPNGDLADNTSNWVDIDSTYEAVPENPKGIGTTNTPKYMVLGTGHFGPNTSGAEHQYTLTIYFPDNGANQDTEKDKTFAAYVSVETSEIENPSA